MDGERLDYPLSPQRAPLCSLLSLLLAPSTTFTVLSESPEAVIHPAIMPLLSHLRTRSRLFTCHSEREVTHYPHLVYYYPLPPAQVSRRVPARVPRSLACASLPPLYNPRSLLLTAHSMTMLRKLPLNSILYHHGLSLAY
jgi:hypothetical protein